MRTLLLLAVPVVAGIAPPPAERPGPAPRAEARATVTIRSGVRASKPAAASSGVTVTRRACEAPVRCTLIIRDIP